MLNNQDFAKLITQPEKVRFDLKQIETWDKEYETRQLKKKTSTKPVVEKESDESAKNAYRDRAEERRKQVVSEEQLQLDSIVSKLDAEQTKFLGGDIEHTHLVKGLDYALLRKNRDSSDVLPNQSISKTKTNDSDTKIRDVVVHTVLGQNIKNVLSLSHHSIDNSKPIKTSSSIRRFHRNIYEFDLNLSSTNDIPTTIQRSKADVDVDEMHFVLPKALLLKLSIALSNYTKNKNKRKKSDTYESTSFDNNKTMTKLQKSATNSTAGTKKIVKNDMHDDIFENISKYVPYGSEETTKDEITNITHEKGDNDTAKTTTTSVTVKINPKNGDEHVNNSNSGVTGGENHDIALNPDKNNDSKTVKSIFEDVTLEVNTFKSSNNSSSSSVKKTVTISASNISDNVISSLIQPKQQQKQKQPTSSSFIHRDILGIGSTSSSGGSGGSSGNKNGGQPQKGDYLSMRGVQASYDIQPDDDEDDDDNEDNDDEKEGGKGGKNDKQRNKKKKNMPNKASSSSSSSS